MIYPGAGLWASDSLYPANDVTPGGDVYPGTDSFPGTSAADTSGQVIPPDGGDTGAEPPEQATWTSPGGELSVTLNRLAEPPRTEISLNLPAAGTVTVLRTDPDGSQWPVRGGDPATLDGNGTWFGFDPEAPYGTHIRYTVTGTGAATDPTVTTGPLRPPAKWGVALIHPAAPELSVPLRLVKGAVQSVTRKARQAMLPILGRRRPIVITDVREATSSQLVVWCPTRAERQALEGLLADGSALRLAYDASARDLGIGQCYIAVGDMTAEPVQNAGLMYPDRVYTLPFTEVDRPAGQYAGAGTPGGSGGGSGLWAYQDLDAKFTTYQQLNAAYASYSDLDLNRAV